MFHFLNNRLRPLLSYWKEELCFLLPRYRTPLKKIVKQLDSLDAESEHHRICLIRNWINRNSIHLIDEEHDSYAFHLPSVISKLAAMPSMINSFPHLSCGPRSYVMRKVLSILRVRVRIIDLFVVRPCNTIDSHTLIEVYNMDTDRWELQDPDFNVVYVNKFNGIPLSGFDAFNCPENIGFDSGGFTIENLKNLCGTIEQFFNIGMLYRFSYCGGRSWFLEGAQFDSQKKIIDPDKCEMSMNQYIKIRGLDPRVLSLNTKSGKVLCG